MLNIAHRSIGTGYAPFVIAEMSGNHNQSLDRALAIVDAAAKAGAHALKLQTYTPDTMTIDVKDGEFFISDPASLWAGQTIYDLYRQAHTPWDWHKPIFDRARDLGMLAFSSPFDETAVDFLETLDVPCYKIASFEAVDLPLIRRVARTGKPMIISTGMATVAELHEAVTAAREAGCRALTLLKCTSTYPATPVHSNLVTIPHLRALFDCEVGLSDHTMGIGAAVAAVALGASVIEKHFTLDRADGGVDSSFSLEPQEFAALVTETERAWQALGTISYGPTAAETRAVTRRRSVYAVRDIAEGEMLTRDNIRCIRPGHGLKPKHYEDVLGKRAKTALSRGTPLTFDVID